MMRHTGGTAVAAISTRSSPFVRAIASACGGGMIPSCDPSSSMTRTSRTLMRSLTRVRSSRRGLLSKAITASLADRGELGRSLTLAVDFVQRLTEELVDAARPQIAAAAAAHRHGALRRLAIPDPQHIRDLLQLRFADLIVDLLLAGVELRPEPRGRQPFLHRRPVGRMPVGNRQDDRLERRQPEREGARVVLDQDRDEALEGSAHRA